MRLGSSWAFFEPYGEPPFVTPFADRDGVVGRRFFSDWVLEHRGTLTKAPPGTGIVASLDTLTSDHFDAGEVHPLVREVYEHTTAIDFLAAKAVFTWYGWLWHVLYNRLIARGMQQLDVPVDPRLLPRRLESEISLLDEDRDGREDRRVWVRSYAGTDRIFYVGAVHTHRREIPGATNAYLDVVLPLWRANLAVVFQPVNLQHGGLALATRRPYRGDAGIHLVFPGRRRYSMMPGLGMHEEIRLTPRADPDGHEWIEGLHRTTWRSLEMYRIPYTLRRHDPSRDTLTTLPVAG
jgi:hypothetical protein